MIVINQVAKGMADSDRISQIKKITDRPMAQVREDQKVNKTARDRGALLVDISTNSATTKDIAKCAEKIIQHLNNQLKVSPPSVSITSASLTDQSAGL